MKDVITYVNAYKWGIENQTAENRRILYEQARRGMLETEEQQKAFRWGVLAIVAERQGLIEQEIKYLKRYLYALERLKE